MRFLPEHRISNGLPTMMLLLFMTSAAYGVDQKNGIKVEILPRSDLKIGDIMQIRLTSPVAGHLIIADRDEAGEVTKLFPGICHKKNFRLRAHIPVTIPTKDYGCEFPAIQAGKGEIIVIVGKKDFALKELKPLFARNKKVRSRSIEVQGYDEDDPTQVMDKAHSGKEKDKNDKLDGHQSGAAQEKSKAAGSQAVGRATENFLSFGRAGYQISEK
jgi:hypothetical protein